MMKSFQRNCKLNRYNTPKTGENTYDIEVALAGSCKDDIEVEYAENMLHINQKLKIKMPKKV